MKILFQILSFGLMGMLLECFFTGFHSVVIERNFRAPCKTYLWMLPIYGIGGFILNFIHNNVVLDVWYVWRNAFLMAGLIYTPLIFIFEFTSGWVLKKIVGRCPWDYGEAKYGIMGLIRLDYAPFWFILTLFVKPVSDILNKLSALI